MSVVGWIGSSNLYVWRYPAQQALLESNRSVNLGWFADLQRETTMACFTSLRRMDCSFGEYQRCEHSDAAFLLSWSYVCNPAYVGDSPWRMSVSGSWDEQRVPFNFSAPCWVAQS